MKVEELKSLIKDAGVAGAGGAGFPTYAKLSDKADKLGKYTLPAMLVGPGESVTVYCDTYTGKEKLHQMCLPFGFKYGESVYFSYRYEILEKLTFIDLHDGYVCRRSLIDSKFYEKKPD